jgi:hypothetical protein
MTTSAHDFSLTEIRAIPSHPPNASGRVGKRVSEPEARFNSRFYRNLYLRFLCFLLFIFDRR